MQYDHQLTMTQRFEGPKTFQAGTAVMVIEHLNGKLRVQTRRGNRFVVPARHVTKLPRT